MKYIDEFRDGERAKGLAAAIAREADPSRRYHLMEFCGGHTHAIARYGVEDLLHLGRLPMGSNTARIDRHVDAGCRERRRGPGPRPHDGPRPVR